MDLKERGKGEETDEKRIKLEGERNEKGVWKVQWYKVGSKGVHKEW